ncbi:MAG TPA: helix-turn-helix transcriptional regulator [Streptosporangiaceae bacterium]|nr:helix-turn-helix transcriptional regulator [Streptosporangiaceae bacterium]
MEHTSGIGDRLAQARADRGLTQDQLAERAGISAKMVSLIERGKRTPGIPTVYALAGALGIEPSRLLDRHDRLGAGDREKGILAVRDALLAPGDLPGLDLDDDGPAAPLAALEQAVETGWQLYWKGRLTDLAALLPPLISAARATVRETGTAACKPLAQAYQLAADLMVHMGNDDLAFGGAMRAMRAAAQGDDPLQEATLAGTASWVLLHQGRLGYAEKVAAKAAENITPRFLGAAGSDEEAEQRFAHLTVYGALLLSAAAPAAAAGNADAAAGYMTEAQVAALSFGGPDRHDYNCSFGRSQMEMQRTHQMTVLGRPDRALKAAAKVLRSDLLPISWGALHLDVATAHLGRKNTPAAIEALLTAHAVSPEWSRHQGTWRANAAAAIRASRRGSERAERLAAAAGLR